MEAFLQRSWELNAAKKSWDIQLQQSWFFFQTYLLHTYLAHQQQQRSRQQKKDQGTKDKHYGKQIHSWSAHSSRCGDTCGENIQQQRPHESESFISPPVCLFFLASPTYHLFWQLFLSQRPSRDNLVAGALSRATIT